MSSQPDDSLSASTTEPVARARPDSLLSQGEFGFDDLSLSDTEVDKAVAPSAQREDPEISRDPWREENAPSGILSSTNQVSPTTQAHIDIAKSPPPRSLKRVATANGDEPVILGVAVVDFNHLVSFKLFPCVKLRSKADQLRSDRPSNSHTQRAWKLPLRMMRSWRDYCPSWHYLMELI